MSSNITSIKVLQKFEEEEEEKEELIKKEITEGLKQVEPIPWTHSALSGTKTVCSVAFSMSPRIFRVKVVRKVSMVGFLPLVYTE